MNLKGSIAFASTMPCVAQTFIIAFANCINPSPSTALNGLTSDTTNATELFNTVSFITFDKLMSDLLKHRGPTTGQRNNFVQVLSMTSSGNFFFWRTL